MEKFKSGDIVKLKSGGPNMTVSNYVGIAAGRESKTVQCKWFAGAKSESSNFYEDMLVPVEEEKK
ncbi:DUF2158 domain-containing protein [Igneacidithiobacillus siniensis]|jgi:uncharacterized protein YodC (DUF2158 family)|uniref:YodC family protein n=1 Tax=Acidithiobacillus TaxID=119977 RepID=UPI00200EE2B2|nr:DUF2158 domain-containing protein [Acidithiobacillus sp. S30A2]MCL5051638.1 DUF2158 domain-containing protein [Gammaproteobacteria bacterium]